MKYQVGITVASLLEMVRSKRDAGESYCVYGRGDSGEATLASECFLDKYPDVTDDDDEVYPDFVTQSGHELWFREELVQDAVANALHQDHTASDEILLAAIKYYNERDCSMVIR